MGRKWEGEREKRKKGKVGGGEGELEGGEGKVIGGTLHHIFFVKPHQA